ncbi:MAG TPA: YafY family protein [Gammaproteobacteria bacterium]|jgi:predicted DNA-binding transcriptional regulator YafY|nr:YafY family protein [Gammaproteobacteria bacterium]
MATSTTRVLAVLELLQTYGRMSGAELARRLEVDARTMRRYIATLEELGIPITSERGRYGAYMLVAGFKLPPMMFNEDEALALSIGLLAARSLGLAEGASAVASAQAKLERVMPAKLKQRLRAVDETVTLDLARGAPPGDNRALTVLSAAAQAQKRVHMHYRSSKGDDSERDFDPYGLLYRNGNWYVGGHCHLRQGLRSFRLDRVADVEMLEAPFTRPDDFDAGAHLDFSIATLPRTTAVEVWLKTDLKTAMLELGEHIGLFEPHPEGVLFKTSTDGIEWMARQLARVSFGFEVREPVRLREALREHARGLLLSH